MEVTGERERIEHDHFKGKSYEIHAIFGVNTLKGDSLQAERENERKKEKKRDILTLTSVVLPGLFGSKD